MRVANRCARRELDSARRAVWHAPRPWRLVRDWRVWAADGDCLSSEIPNPVPNFDRVAVGRVERRTAPLTALLKRLAAMILACLILYFIIGAALLRFQLDRWLFPRTDAFAGPQATQVHRIALSPGVEGLVRQYGGPVQGCLVVFPGQHGYLPAYDPGPYTESGLSVWIVAYPGQDGAVGTATIANVEALASEAVRLASNRCLKGKLVVLGVSLGSGVAASSLSTEIPAGLILVSAAPSLSAAIRTRLAAKWYLAPLTVLPLSRILPRDYSLNDALGSRVDVVILQGTDDVATPITSLREALRSSLQSAIVPINGGTHSTTFTLSQSSQLSSIMRQLRASVEEP